jgi:hypothetical protein
MTCRPYSYPKVVDQFFETEWPLQPKSRCTVAGCAATLVAVNWLAAR